MLPIRHLLIVAFAAVTAVTGSSAHADAAPWLVIDIDHIGPAGLEALKQDPRVQHWTELGDRLLVRADEGFAAAMRAQGRVGATFDGGLALVVEPHFHCGLDAAADAKAAPAHAHRHDDDVLLAAAGWRLRSGSAHKAATAPRHGEVVAWQAANRAADPAPADPRIAALVAAVEPDRWHATMTTLAAHDRLTAPGFGAALARVAAEFSALGLAPEATTFTYPQSLAPHAQGDRNRNITARQPGRGDGIVIVGAHLDSRNEDWNLARPSPGAEDNAGGCAAVLETARVLRNTRFDADILYVCYGMEEVGLVGSAGHAAALGEQRNRVRAMINLDMIAFDGTGRLDMTLSGTETSRILLERMASLATRHTALNPTVSMTTCCSDHMPYLAWGIPAMMISSTDFPLYTHYHRTTDTDDKVSRQQGGEATRLAVAAVADAAGMTVRSDINGYWYDPAQSGHGLHIEAQQDGAVLATWYTFDADGERFWLIATGTIDDDVAELDAFAVDGGVFPPAFDPAAVRTTRWGSLRIEFADCATALLGWQVDAGTAGFTDGSMPLVRLSRPSAGGCH